MMYRLRHSVALARDYHCRDCDAGPLRAYVTVGVEQIERLCIACARSAHQSPSPPGAPALPLDSDVTVAMQGQPFLRDTDGTALHREAEAAGWTMQANAPSRTHGYYRRGNDEHAVVLKNAKGELGLVRLQSGKQ